MFWAAGELYGLDFKENHRHGPGLAPGHPHLRGHRPRDRQAVVGLFYRDNFARDGKRSGAWATTYRSRASLLGDDIVLGSNNNNFTKPGPGEPVLISLDDAETLFHEFGHAIHYFLSNVNYPSLGGSQRDFVEYPSQVNENWLLTPEVLQRFAKHYQTGQPMPQALVDKIEKAQTFNQGFATVEYLVVGDRRHEAAHRPERRRRSRRVREEGAGRDRHAEGDRDAAPPAAVQSPLLVRRLLGRLLFLPLVGDDGRRHLGGVRGGRQPVGQEGRGRLQDATCCRPATRPTAPRPTASSAAAIRTSTRCSASAASR